MKWYHATNRYNGNEHQFVPSLARMLQKGEDKSTPRICVTGNWRHSLRSIILIKRSQEFFIYSTDQQPVNPIKEREKLLSEKTIRKNQILFQLPKDGFVNKEHWFLKPTTFELEGVVTIPKDDYLAMLMGLGFMNEPDINKLSLKPYVEKLRL